MKEIIKKLLLVIASVIFILLLAELVLFLSGEIYYAYRIKNKIKVSLDKNIVKILCLGDSFTFGMGADKGYSYPEQLERILNEKKLNNKRYAVFNRGMPGNTSSKLLNHLGKNLQTYNPDILIIGIGMNDNSCLEETNYFLFKRGGMENKLLYYLNNTKVYRLFKSASDALEVILWKKRLMATYGTNRIFESLKSKDIEPLNTDPGRFQEAKKHNDLGKEKYFNEQNIKINLAIEEFQKAIEIMPNDKEGYENLAQVFLHIDKFDLAVNQLEKVKKIDPYDKDVWNKLWLIYYRTGQVNLAEEALKRYLYLNPSDIPEYLLFLKYGFPDIKDDKTFENLLSDNLQKIIDIVKRRKVSLILQNYPGVEDIIFNISAVAQKNKVPFIDHSSVFKKLTLQEGYRYLDYFVEDTHCNNKGYSVMAENVYYALRSILKDSDSNRRK